MTRNPGSRRISILPAALLLCCASATIAVAQSASTGGARRTAQATQAPQPNRGPGRAPGRARGVNRSPVVVRARANDTLAALAARFNISVEDLAHANSLRADARLQPGQQLLVPSGSSGKLNASKVSAPVSIANDAPVSANDVNRLRLTDGTVIECDDAWEDAQGFWYRKGGVVHLVQRNRVAGIDRKAEAAEAVAEERVVNKGTKAKIVEVGEAKQSGNQSVWIFLVGGARVEAEEVTETQAGAWYKRGGLSIFLDRSRIERIERERPADVAENSVADGSWINRGWTTGNQNVDRLIRQNGQRFGVDPYLIFCVMEQESRFNQRALSPKGASGLMQLMPGTAARFGVRSIFDPQQNIMGGTRYLKLLLEQFNGRVDLVLASYNAGEGAVMKYGRSVPPYRETRDYVRRIGTRYGQTNSLVQPTAMTTASTRQK